MISTFAVAYATEGTHLTSAYEASPTGNEDMIVITMPTGFTLGQLGTLSWSVFAVSGYPPHVDIILVDDIDGEPNIDSLTAELASNSNPQNKEWNNFYVENPPYLQDDYVYDQWQKTFELNVGTGDIQVDGDTVFWVTRHGAGPGNAPYGTLDELKAGAVTYPDVGDPTITISSAVVIEKLEIEIDNWLGGAEAFVKDILVNDKDVTLTLEVMPPIVSIMVAPSSIDFGPLKYLATAHKEVTVYNIGDVHVTVETETMGEFFIANLVVTDPAGKIAPGGDGLAELDLTVPFGATPGIHTGKLVFVATPGPP